MKIEVIHLEVAELDEESKRRRDGRGRRKIQLWEESLLTRKAHHSQSVIFVKEVVMLKKIVGSKGSLNASIVKNLGMLKKIADLRTINKQVVLRRKRLMKTCFMLVKVLLSKRIMCGFDSGCTNHMTGNKNIFLDMDTTINSQVKMGNGDLVNVKGRGTVGIQTKVGTKYIRDVLLVPALEQNLLVWDS
ncbi:hypothetical protein CK203_018868 [Vitis vinifera]|uniref:Retrovirus-related Pol polyprotein from transposon TNT 1-94-like beta-barrel domain-containing protein n=1 Tax=Vitis vinifera TaxID=29760 RepID=A0A438IQW1_VITVI|nr:hypothetical protein CK203_018868 [Vitis vinifera]